MQTIFRSAKGFFCGTFLSRLSGLFRDLAMAYCFGGSVEVAAFLVAYRLSNLFRRVLGEGNLQAGFIPQFERMRGEGFEKACEFYRGAAWFLGSVSGIVIGGCVGVLWAVRGYLGESWREVADLTMWMLPGLFFICLSGLHQALMQSQKKYFVPSVLPAVFNGVWIAAAFVSGGMRDLAIWVTIGAVVQWSISAWRVRMEFAGVEKRRGGAFSWRELAGPMTLGLVGTAAVQINSALDAIFARVADLSGPAYLWYAIRVEQLPLALFGLALSGALLPPLARAIREGDEGRFYAFLKAALRRGSLLIIPSTFGIFALGRVGLNFLYGHGHFEVSDVEQTAQCLWAYGAGLIPSVLVLLVTQGYYAKKKYWQAARVSLIAVAANILLNSFFVWGLKWGSVSVAIATSVSSFVNAYLLLKGLPESVDREVLRLSGKVTLASLTAAALTIVFQAVSFGGLALGGWEKGWQLGSSAVLYLAVFCGASWLLRLSEMWEILKPRDQSQKARSES